MPLKTSEISPGVPVPWALVDPAGHVVVAKGAVLQSSEEIEALVAHGVLREVKALGGEDDGALTFESIRMQIGDGLQLQGLVGEANQRFVVRLIGAVRGKSVLVSYPMEDGKYAPVKEGQSFVARAFRGKLAFAFRTQLRKIINVPFPYLHLEYPSDVKGLTVRQHARLGVTIIVAVARSNGDSGAGTIVDLSVGGARLEAKRPIGEKNETVVLKMKVVFEGEEHVLKVPAIIRAIDAQPNEAGFIPHGLQFVNLAPQDQLVLSAFVYRRLLEESSDI